MDAPTPQCRVLDSRLTRWGNGRHSPITDSLRGFKGLSVCIYLSDFQALDMLAFMLEPYCDC